MESSSSSFSITSPGAESQRIASISARGVLGEFDYDLAFEGTDDGRRMKVVYAPNGMGKTNFLRAVNHLLTPGSDSMIALVDIPVRSLRITFQSESLIELRRESSESGTFRLEVTEGGETVGVTVDPTELGSPIFRRIMRERSDFATYSAALNRVTCLAEFIGDDRLAIAATESDPNSSFDRVRPGSRRKVHGTSLKDLIARVERMLTQAAVSGLSSETIHSGVYAEITKTTLNGSSKISAAAARASLETKIERIIAQGIPYEKYGLLSLRQVREVSAQISVVRHNHRQLPSLHTVLAPYLDSISEQIESLGPAQRLIDTFVTTVNQFLERKRLVFTGAGGIALLNRNREMLEVESLSSGERHLIHLLSQAILATSTRNLIIIDEPELSLGLEWQRELLGALLRCTASADVQFLVASHSVQIMNAVEDVVSPTEDFFSGTF